MTLSTWLNRHKKFFASLSTLGLGLGLGLGCENRIQRAINNQTFKIEDFIHEVPAGAFVFHGKIHQNLKNSSKKCEYINKRIATVAKQKAEDIAKTTLYFPSFRTTSSGQDRYHPTSSPSITKTRRHRQSSYE